MTDDLTQTLLGFAAAFRGARECPTAIALLADALTALVRPAASGERIVPSGVRPDAVQVRPDVGLVLTTPSSADVIPSTSGPPSGERIVPSPSPTTDLKDQEKKKGTDGRMVTFARGDDDRPPPEWAVEIHAKVLVDRPKLPPLTFIWPNFVSYVLEAGKTYRTPDGLKKAYRDFLRRERPWEPSGQLELPAAPPSSRPAQRAAPPPPPKPRPVRETPAELASIFALGQSILHQRASGVLARTEPASAPPSRAPAVA